MGEVRVYRWRPPPIHCEHLDKGKKLFNAKEYAAAATCFQTCLDNLPSQALTHEDGDIYTFDEIIISTRLFVLRALWKQSETCTTFIDQVLDEMKAILLILSTRTKQCRFALCMVTVSTIARIINDDVIYKGASLVYTSKDISNMGIQACRIILDESSYGNIKERRNLYSIECDLYERLGDLQAAAESIKSLLKESPKDQSQQKRLREFHIKLGLVDVVEAEEAKVDASRQHKKRQRLKRKGKHSAHLGGILDTVQSDVSATLSKLPSYNFFSGLDSQSQTCTLVNSSEGEKAAAAIIDWSSIPDDIKPKFENKNKEKRLLRKKKQLESLYILLRDLVKKISTIKGTGHPIHICDFGSGSGNSCLVFAYLLLQNTDIPCRFTLIDNNPHSVALGKERTFSGLDVQWLCKDVAGFDEAFDIGLATHLCGGATDVMMERCMFQKAAFIATPCCLGSIVFDTPQNTVSGAKRGRGYGRNTDKRNSLTYPRSTCFRNQITVDDYAFITRLADCSLTTNQSNDELQIRGKRFLDSDRLKLAQEANYDTSFGKLGSKASCGPRSDVLCGICF